MSGLKRYQALGRLPAGTMNKTEAAYALRLEALKQAGEVLWYKFESINLRLAANTFYKVDFMVLTNENALEAHEVKGGYITEDSVMKIKIAASLYPFRFVMMIRQKGQWSAKDY